MGGRGAGVAPPPPFPSILISPQLANICTLTPRDGKQWLKSSRTPTKPTEMKKQFSYTDEHFPVGFTAKFAAEFTPEASRRDQAGSCHTCQRGCRALCGQEAWTRHSSHQHRIHISRGHRGTSSVCASTRCTAPTENTCFQLAIKALALFRSKLVERSA